MNENEKNEESRIVITYEMDIAKLSVANVDGIQIAQAVALLTAEVKRKADAHIYAAFTRLVDNYVSKICNPDVIVNLEDEEEEEDDE